MSFFSDKSHVPSHTSEPIVTSTNEPILQSPHVGITLSFVSFLITFLCTLGVGFFIGFGTHMLVQKNEPAVQQSISSVVIPTNRVLSPTPVQMILPSFSPIRAASPTAQASVMTNATASAAPTPLQAGTTPIIGPCPVFPSDNPWNQDISTLPIHMQSNAYITSIGIARSLHPDFGGASYGKIWGIPFLTVTNSQPQMPITFTAYGNESDPGPYPIPLTAPIEGGADTTGDRHVLVINTDTCKLYEMYRSFPTATGWKADSGAIFDLRSNTLRHDRWTSADAAGLPIFPGLVRYEEVQKGRVNHAIRFTTKKTQRAYISPARHFASTSTDATLPPMGLRVRLKATYDITKLPPQAKVIATAMKKYGLILADNGGDWFFQGDAHPSWDDADINTLKTIPGSAFEAVETGPLIK
jgi:hypothetical protein